MPVPPLHTASFTIPALECDFQNRWKPLYMLQAMQRAANTHAALLGAGFEVLAEHQQTWIFSRLKIRFNQLPAADQSVTLRTVTRGVSQKLFFRRDFLIDNEEGSPVARATTLWLLLDTSTWCLLPPAALRVSLPEESSLTGLDELLEKLNPPEVAQPNHVVSAAYNTIDLLGHVNNTRYMEWVTDCFSLEHYRQHSLSWLQINYTNQVLPGQQVALFCAPREEHPGAWWVYGKNLSDGRRAFEAEVGWQG